jgi:hypothetical protein
MMRPQRDRIGLVMAIIAGILLAAKAARAIVKQTSVAEDDA